MERQFNRVAVTDGMLEVLRDALNTDINDAEHLMKQILAKGGLGLVRAKGSYHAEADLADLEKNGVTEEQRREIRMQCLSMSHDIANADAMVQFILTGKKPGEA